MRPAPLNPQLPLPPGSLGPPAPAHRRAAAVEALYWLDMRTKEEGGNVQGWREEFTEVLCAEPPARAGDIVSGWMIEEDEDSYVAGRGNVIVAGLRIELEFGA